MMPKDEGRLLRCEWFREHIKWIDDERGRGGGEQRYYWDDYGNDVVYLAAAMDLSLFYVMARRWGLMKHDDDIDDNGYVRVMKKKEEKRKDDGGRLLLWRGVSDENGV